MGFLWRIAHWFVGYAEVCAEGMEGERFLSLCRKADVDLWRIRRTASGVLEFRAYEYALPLLEKPAAQCGIALRIDRKGLLPWIRRYRFRPGLFVGAVLYLFLIWFLSLFIWSVEIPGTDSVRSAQIRQDLLLAGFGPGSFSPAVDYKGLRYQLSLADPEIAFVSVNKTGCRAVVEVRYGSKIPELAESEPCNLVASRDGVIVSVLVLDGVRYVQKGQAVRQGDLLVGGIFNTRLGYYVVHARADILAYVTETRKQTVELDACRPVRTGRKTVRYRWNIYGKEFSFSTRPCPYEQYETEETVKCLSLGNRVELPVVLTQTAYYETESRRVTYSPEQAEALARDILDERDRVWKNTVNVETENESVVVSGGVLTLTRTYGVITDIGIEKEFYFEDEG